MANDKKKRNLEVLKNAVDKSREGNGAPRGGGGAPGSGSGGGGGGQIMYRGKPVGRSGSSGAPGSAGGRGRPNQASKSQRPSTSPAAEGGDVKEALRKLTQLFNDGLITTAEYDAKRAEILNRL